MRVLLDHCTPRNLRRELREHQVTTAKERGWQEVQNGELLKKAVEEEYDVLVTADENIRYQQNIKNTR